MIFLVLNFTYSVIKLLTVTVTSGRGAWHLAVTALDHFVCDRYINKRL